MEITKKSLIENNAPSGFIEWFDENFPKGGADHFYMLECLYAIKDPHGWAPWIFRQLGVSGYCKRWHANERLWVDARLIEGMLDGLYQRRHANGRLWMEVNYINGKRNGEYREFDQLGRLTFKGQFTYGLANGVFQRFKRRKLVNLSRWKDGKLVGILHRPKIKDDVTITKDLFLHTRYGGFVKWFESYFPNGGLLGDVLTCLEETGAPGGYGMLLFRTLKRSGVCRTFSRFFSTLIEQRRYRNGYLHGPYKCWDHKGQVRIVLYRNNCIIER